MRYKINEVNKHRFIQVPVELFTNELYSELSNDARILYSFLLDRMELSRKNNWINEKEEIFLIYPRADIEKLLKVSHKTCVKMFKQLNEVKLIEEERMGLNKPNRIFINHIIYAKPSEINGSVKSTHQEVNNLHIKKSNNYTSESVENTHQDVENLHPIYTNNNYTENNYTNTSNKRVGKESTFNNFKQRKYEDIDKLERQLLGWEN